MHNKTEHFVCEICRKKHDNKDELDVHMNHLHKDTGGMVICGVNGCARKYKVLETVLAHVRLDHDRVADRICKDCNKPYLRITCHRRQHHIDPSLLKTCTACRKVQCTLILCQICSKYCPPWCGFAANTHSGIWYAIDLGELKCFKKKRIYFFSWQQFFYPTLALAGFSLFTTNINRLVFRKMDQISRQQVNRQQQRKRLTQIFQYLQGWNSTFAI